MERTAAQKWERRRLQSAAMVPGQRNGRSLADRTHERDGVWLESGRRGAADALCGPIAEAGGLRVERAGHADLFGMGPASFGRMLRVCGRDFAASLLRECGDFEGDRRRLCQVS